VPGGDRKDRRRACDHERVDDLRLETRRAPRSRALWLNPRDAAARGIADGSRVEVRSAGGAFAVPAA